MVVLVILHHGAVIYAANTAFYYVEPTKHYACNIRTGIFPVVKSGHIHGIVIF